MRIVLADDHDLIRDVIAEHLLRVDPTMRVSSAGNLSEAVEAARAGGHVDLIVLDLRMPGMNGIEGLRAVLAQFPEIPVAILSGDSNPDVARASLEAGAAGFIPKTMRGSALAGVLRLIASGERYVPDYLVISSGAASNSSAKKASGLPALTERERAVFRYLLEGFSNKGIGRRLGIEEVTVALHLRSIYRKLNVKSRVQAVRYAHENGWN
jgi:DNA-binding NarL/FixJ family response regulator